METEFKRLGNIFKPACHNAQSVLIEGNVVESKFAAASGDEFMALSRDSVIEPHNCVCNQGPGWIADYAGDGAILNLCVDRKKENDQQNNLEWKIRLCWHLILETNSCPVPRGIPA